MWSRNSAYEQSSRGPWTKPRIVGAILLLFPLLSAPQPATAVDANSPNSGPRHSLIDQQKLQELRTRVAELRAKVEEQKRHHNDNGGLSALQTQVTELQNSVAALGSTNSTLLTSLQTAQSQIVTLQTRVTTLENAGSGGGGSSFSKYVTVDMNPINGVSGPHLIFTGVNVHIRSGSGATDDSGNPTGLGNLILGYNEPDPANPPQRNGSHNVVAGTMNSFSSFGGAVFGFRNRLSGQYATILGGDSSVASGVASSVLGGAQGTASGLYATVLGGSGGAAATQFGVAPKYTPAP